jgi:hypothetical protein
MRNLPVEAAPLSLDINDLKSKNSQFVFEKQGKKSCLARYKTSRAPSVWHCQATACFAYSSCPVEEKRDDEVDREVDKW